MKKAYSAPQILFEDFSLSTSIAGDCKTIMDTQAENVCAYPTRSGENIFLSSVSACVTTEADGQYDKYCYHVPLADYVLFNS